MSVEQTRNSGNALAVKLAITIIYCLVALLSGAIVGVAPAVSIFLAVITAALIIPISAFDYAIVLLLILRSAIDTFSALQLPSVFAVGIDAITIAYVGLKVLKKEIVKTDGFFFFFAGWCAFQSLWVFLIALGGLGASSALVGESVREFVRVSSWLLVYLLIMQFRGRIKPKSIAG